MGGSKAPKPAPQTTPPPQAPDPADKVAKEKEAEERQKVQMKRGSSRTVATSPMGVLGAAPTNAPELKGSLG
jgi:hypothetical protein